MAKRAASKPTIRDSVTTRSMSEPIDPVAHEALFGLSQSSSMQRSTDQVLILVGYSWHLDHDSDCPDSLQQSRSGRKTIHPKLITQLEQSAGRVVAREAKATSKMALVPNVRRLLAGGHGAIHETIAGMVRAADMLVFDLSVKPQQRPNPNVAFELGIACGLNAMRLPADRVPIVLVFDGKTASLAGVMSDLAGVFYVDYEESCQFTRAGKQHIADALIIACARARRRHSGRPSNGLH
jgi:hypothetical protein